MLSVRTFRFGSDNGDSLSHLLKARTAKVVGMCWDSQGLTVDGERRRLDGSNVVGLVDWADSSYSGRPFGMGVAAGLEAEGPVAGEDVTSPGFSPTF